MIATSTKRTTCRLCDATTLERVVHLDPIPPADQYVSQDQLGQRQELFPLDLSYCLSCCHLQLLDVVNPDILFRDYLYTTSTSPGLVEHFRRYADSIAARFPYPEGSLVVELGSNEGVLLRFFKDKGFSVLGVDPARQIANRATQSGVETLPEFFTLNLATEIRRQRGPAAIVSANNVFAHSDDLIGMAKGVRALLLPESIFVFEVSYMADMIDKMLFDVIYHEHLSYHSLGPLLGFMERHDMQIFDAERIPTKAGSLRCFAQAGSGHRTPTAAIQEILRFEQHLGLGRKGTYREFEAKVNAVRKQMRELAGRLKTEGKTIAAYGAAPNSTTLIYNFGLDDSLDFIVDDNPRKQGRFSPGCHLPICSPKMLLERRPDFTVLLAWTYAEKIVAANQPYLSQGGRFIIPLPEVKVVP